MALTNEELLALRKKRRAELKENEIKELKEQLSVRERLERKLETDEIHLELQDDFGPFTMTFRKLSPNEHDRLTTIMQIEMPAATDKTQKDALTNELYQIIGSASLDDGINPSFWRKKVGYSPDIFLNALLKIVTESSMPDKEYLQKIQSFRQ